MAQIGKTEAKPFIDMRNIENKLILSANRKTRYWNWANLNNEKRREEQRCYQE